MTIFACPISVTFDVPVVPEDCDCPSPGTGGGTSTSETSPKQFFLQLLNIMTNEYDGEIKNECC